MNLQEAFLSSFSFARSSFPRFFLGSFGSTYLNKCYQFLLHLHITRGNAQINALQINSCAVMSVIRATGSEMMQFP